VHDKEGAPDCSSLSPGPLRWDGAPRLVAGQKTDGGTSIALRSAWDEIFREPKIDSSETIATGKRD